MQLALAEPRGPVHLDLPADVASRPALPAAVAMPAPTCRRRTAPGARRGGRADRAGAATVVMAGLAVSAGDAKWLRAFCEAMPAPILTTVKAKGVIPDPHPLAWARSGRGRQRPCWRARTS